MLQQFVTSLPIEYGSALDLLGTGVGVGMTRAGVVYRVPDKYAQLTLNDVSLINNGKDKGNG